MKKETQTIEFKPSWSDNFLMEICGFANGRSLPWEKKSIRSLSR